MGGGSSPPDRTSSVSSQQLDPALQEIARTSAAGLQAEQAAVLPQLGRIAGFDPQHIPGLTPTEMQLLNQGAAFYQSQLGPIGQSPLFQSFRRTQLPEILQGANLQGLGEGGIAEIVANAADREAMQIAQMQGQAIQSGLQIASLPRDIATQQSLANYQERQRLQQLLEQTVNAPFGQLAPAGARSITETKNVGGGK